MRAICVYRETRKVDNVKVVERTDDEVTAALIDDEFAGLTPEQADVAALLLPKLTAKIGRQAEAKYGAEYRARFTQLEAENKKALSDAIDSLRKTMAPLSDVEIKSLLEQEYGEFNIPAKDPHGSAVVYTIRELSLANEQRVLKAVRTSVGPILKVLSSVEWQSLAGASQLERLEKVLDLVPSAAAALGACVAICLDQRKEHEWLTPEWVTANMGLPRMFNILTAQLNASHYRDFISLASRLFRQTQMMG